MAEINLPTLDIEEDLEVLMKDDIVTDNAVKNTVEVPEEPEEEDEDPVFAKPKKQKRVCSEKQLQHLARVRDLAKEKKQTKADAKLQALEKVNTEHKTNYSVVKEKQLASAEKRAIAKKTINLNKEVTKPPPKSAEQVEFNKRVTKSQEEINLESFSHFMGNMEKYSKLREEYENNKPKPKPPPPAPKPVAKTAPQAKPVPFIPAILRPPVTHIYDDYFG